MSKAYIFDVAVQKIFFNGSTGFIPSFYLAGADTLEECEAEARKAARTYIRSSDERGLANIYTGWFKSEIRKPCATCKVTGIKPGCKRKACPDCGGRGSHEVTNFVFDAR